MGITSVLIIDGLSVCPPSSGGGATCLISSVVAVLVVYMIQKLGAAPSTEDLWCERGRLNLLCPDSRPH